jgi:hypothetical protein
MIRGFEGEQCIRTLGLLAAETAYMQPSNFLQPYVSPRGPGIDAANIDQSERLNY